MGDYSVKVRKAERIIHLRMSGSFELAEMKQASKDYRDATDSLGPGKHLVFADMRGMKTMFKEVAEEFGGVIQYGRAKGTVRCAHLSDDTVQRLQAARLARKITPGDDITIDVVSEEEAEKVLKESASMVR